jgi:hypothetical protein
MLKRFCSGMHRRRSRIRHFFHKIVRCLVNGATQSGQTVRACVLLLLGEVLRFVLRRTKSVFEIARNRF